MTFCGRISNQCRRRLVEPAERTIGMNSIIIDAPATDEKRRELLYRGQLLVYSPTRSSLALVEFARKMAEEAFHPHRDTWYSAPMCQINWWMPIYPIVAENAMAFHPRYWSKAVRNGSAGYNYDEWNRTSRHNASQFVKQDTRVQPKPEEPMELDPQIRVIAPPGGILLFSAAQMHSSVPNNSGRTRFSIDFRTVNIDDVAERRGAPNVDSACTGTTMGDYLRGSDLAHISQEYFSSYQAQPPIRKAEEFEAAASVHAS